MQCQKNSFMVGGRVDILVGWAGYGGSHLRYMSSNPKPAIISLPLWESSRTASISNMASFFTTLFPSSRLTARWMKSVLSLLHSDFKYSWICVGKYGNASWNFFDFAWSLQGSAFPLLFAFALPFGTAFFESPLLSSSSFSSPSTSWVSAATCFGWSSSLMAGASFSSELLLLLHHRHHHHLSSLACSLLLPSSLEPPSFYLPPDLVVLKIFASSSHPWAALLVRPWPLSQHLAPKEPMLDH